MTFHPWKNIFRSFFYMNYKDRGGGTLATFSGNASFSTPNWFYSSVADTVSSGYNTPLVICFNNKMHRNHASVVCRLNAKLFYDVKWYHCKPLSMIFIYESFKCS